jgi:hypothetical protein
MEMQMREIKVFVGVGLGPEEIKEVLNGGDIEGQESTLLFEVAHALLVEHKDDRAEVHEVIVEEVIADSSHPSQVQIEFTTSWTAFYGCRDMNMSDEEHESESATYTSDGHLIFMVPTPRRPANDC